MKKLSLPRQIDANRRAKIAATWRGRREKMRMTMTAFSLKYRIGLDNLCRYETGKLTPSQTTVERVEAALEAEKKLFTLP